MKRKKDKIAVASDEETAKYAPRAAGEQPLVSQAEAPAGSAVDATQTEGVEGAESIEPPTPEQRIEQLEAEHAELKDKLLRAQAECANISKRWSQQHAASVKIAGMKLACALLPVMDSFDRTLGVLDEAREDGGGQDDVVAEGVRLIAEEFRKAFREQGIVAMDVAGETFDPMRHEAMMQDKDSDAPAGTVTRVFQPGYLMHDRVLRPAKVAVAAGAGDGADANVDVVEAPTPSNES